MTNNILPKKTPPGNNRPTEPPKNNKLITALFVLVTLAIAALAAGAFVLSFNALRELATTAGGIAPRLAWVWPLMVDLSLVVYTATILTSQLQRWPVWLPAALVVFYSVVTITGNIMHAPPTWAGWFIAALPPLSLVLASEALRVLIKNDTQRRAAVASLSDLTAARDTAAGELDNLTAQIDRLTAQRDTLQSDIKQVKTAQNARSVNELNAARQAKIDDRRAQVMTLVKQGEAPADIAAALDVSPRTIKRDIKSLNGQLAGVTS